MNAASSPAKSVVAELRIPRPNLSKAVILAAMVLLVAVGMFNLVRLEVTPAISLVATVIILLLIGASARAGCIEAGSLRQFLINCADVFGSIHFVQILRDSNQENGFVAHGYRVFGWSLYKLKIEAAQLSTVGWSYGQATSLAHEDCSDWSVHLWYRINAEHAEVAFRTHGGKRFHEIGPTRSKEKTEVLGRELIALLENAGIVFAQTAEGEKRELRDLGNEYRQIVS